VGQTHAGLKDPPARPSQNIRRDPGTARLAQGTDSRSDPARSS
jgi:hypothetical protein